MKWYSALIDVSKTILRQILLIIVSIGLATVFLWISGYEPFSILNGMWESATAQLSSTVRWSTGLILAGLAVCVTFKAEIWNLGIDGQIYMGGAAASALALALPETSQFTTVSGMVLVGMLAGALYALIPALLKVFFNTNEVVSTLLLNFIALRFVEYLVSGPMQDPTSITKLNASMKFPAWAWVPRLKYFDPSPANIGFYFALAAVVIMAFVFYKTKLGYEIKIIGTNSNLGVYGGMKPKWVTIMVMCMSGSLAGLIGVIECGAVQHRLMNAFNPGFGFDGIVVSLLANNNPIGIILSGLFFGNLKNAGIAMERATDTPSAITDIVMAIVILTITANFVIPKIKAFRKQKKITQSKAGSDN